jgi:hypothetical protein
MQEQLFLIDMKTDKFTFVGMIVDVVGADEVMLESYPPAHPPHACNFLTEGDWARLRSRKVTWCVARKLSGVRYSFPPIEYDKLFLDIYFSVASISQYNA